MNLHSLETTPGSRKNRHRVGRGDGSGWGGTCGRGEKGQRSRSGAAGQTPSFRRIPKRGFKMHGVKEVFNVVNVGTLNEVFEAGTEINEEVLLKAGLVAKNKAPLKVLGTGEVSKALKVKAQKFSASAKAKIEAAGGSVEVIE